MYPNTTVRRTWEAADGEVELLLVGKGMAIQRSAFESEHPLLSFLTGLITSLPNEASRVTLWKIA